MERARCRNVQCLHLLWWLGCVYAAGNIQTENVMVARKKRAKAWLHFKKKDDNRAACNVFKMIIKMLKHLPSQHRLKFQECNVSDTLCTSAAASPRRQHVCYWGWYNNVIITSGRCSGFFISPRKPKWKWICNLFQIKQHLWNNRNVPNLCCSVSSLSLTGEINIDFLCTVFSTTSFWPNISSVPIPNICVFKSRVTAKLFSVRVQQMLLRELNPRSIHINITHQLWWCETAPVVIPKDSSHDRYRCTNSDVVSLLCCAPGEGCAADVIFCHAMCCGGHGEPLWNICCSVVCLSASDKGPSQDWPD